MTMSSSQTRIPAHLSAEVVTLLRSLLLCQIAEHADKAAERVAEISDYLKRSDGDAILRDVERFGRERPWAVMAGGVVLGIAASRFLKASSSRRYHEQESSRNLPARTADVDRNVLPASQPAVDATTHTVPSGRIQVAVRSGAIVRVQPPSWTRW